MELGRAPEPLFVLSLPRSGSTLLQRMLALHPDVASSAEPWVLLPLLYSLRTSGVAAEYGHATAARAINEFCTWHVPGGTETYLAEVRELVLQLYRAAGAGHRYFVDKTPRYHLIASDLLTLLPEARVIFLWRNPLAVAASMIDSWNGGRWNLDTHSVDLISGVDNLTAAVPTAGDRATSIRYEDLVQRPEEELRRLIQWLGLPAHAGLETKFSEVRFPGSMGDPDPRPDVSRESLVKWQATLANPVRRAWAHRYLDRVGSERLAVMGYDSRELRAELDDAPMRLSGIAGDVCRIAFGAASRFAVRAAVKRRRVALFEATDDRNGRRSPLAGLRSDGLVHEPDGSERGSEVRVLLDVHDPAVAPPRSVRVS